MLSGTSMPLTGTLTLEGGTHTAKNVTVAENANVTFASGIYEGATIDGTATVKAGVTFTDSTVTVNGTLNVEGGTFNGPVEFNGSSIANISGGTFTSDRVHGGVQFSNYSGTGTISGGTFVLAWFYSTKVKLSGGTFNEIVSSGDNKLAALLAEGAAYYGASDNQAVTNDRLNKLENVKVVSHTHDGGTDGQGHLQHLRQADGGVADRRRQDRAGTRPLPLPSRRRTRRTVKRPSRCIRMWMTMSTGSGPPMS